VDFAAFTGFDAGMTAAVRSLASPAATRVLWVATLLGDATVMTVWTVLAVVLLWAWGRRRPAIVLAALMIADPLIVGALKALFARPRPPAGGMLLAGTPTDLPSGHAVASMLCWGLLGLFAVLGTGPVWRKALAVCAALGGILAVGVSRVYLGVHYPSDVLAGWASGVGLVGAGWGALVLWTRLRGPEAAPELRDGSRVRLRLLAAGFAAVALAAVVRQAGIDPLL
jgi:membrane-associated phospholipid phosphatase